MGCEVWGLVFGVCGLLVACLFCFRVVRSSARGVMVFGTWGLTLVECGSGFEAWGFLYAWFGVWGLGFGIGIEV